MKSFMANAQNIERKWYVVDAEGMVLGRLASQVASILRGKNKPTYTPHVDTGDYVIIVNADKIVLTGNKLEDKMYYKHSHYPGGLKETNAKNMLVRHPEFPVWDAVRGMLPHTPLGAAMLDKLHVYAGPNHPHQAQQPEELKL